MLTSRIFKNLSIVVRPASSVSTLRTHNCGELSLKNAGEKVCIMGWLAYKRMDRFLVLRDRYGYVQGTFNPASEIASIAKNLTYESVLKIEGTVRSRGSNVNEKMATGQIEVELSSLTVMNRCDPHLPFDPNGNVAERIRLKYRYLDIRGDRLQSNLRLRSTIERAMSRYLEDNYNFEKVETPTLFRRTPGGAAEFLVPCGPPNLGSCYSLPQSPQQHKQLLMVGGWDRYYQIARCYRDEGSKGDRQPEFTQVDIEMSFTNQREILQVIEGMIIAGWPESLSDLKPSAPFPRLSYKDAMKLYGIDKPDMRIPWIIEDATDILDGLNPGNVDDWCARIIVCRGQAPNTTSSRRKEWKRLIQMNSNGRPFDVYTPHKKQWFKFIENSKIMERFNVDKEDSIVFCWGDEEGVQWTLGQLRNLVAEAGGLRKQRSITCHWIVDFPLFTVEDGKLVSTHHPFTAPVDEDREKLMIQEELSKITGQHYDLVINGVEMGGGSIRIHNAEEQGLVLEILKEDASEMVIAFPKTKEGRDLMCDSPVAPSKELLQRYGIALPPENERGKTSST